MKRGTRRDFFGAALAGALVTGCGESKPRVEIPEMRDTAPDGPVLRAGLVGCGGRGTGAAVNFLKAGPNLELVALGDLFQDRIDGARKTIREEMQVEVPDEMCFVGFDAYRKVIDAGIDVFIHATPPHFRPMHFAAAVEAGKHCFIEKPVAVDPAGVRSIIESAGQAQTKGLSVVSGTCYRHQKKVMENYRRVAEGAIGDILAARAYYNTSQLWYRERQEGWSDMEWMIRDWVNWLWLSGDHIVEQNVHNLDTISLYLGMTPVKCVAFGSRQRRVTGNQYDNFAVDFEYANGLHLMNMCRQINGCANKVTDHLVGTEGSTNCHGTIWNRDGSVMWDFEEELKASGGGEPKSMYDQEHIDLVTSIRTSEPRNEITATAHSTLMGIMGRESAYTGGEVTWDGMLNADMRLGPDAYELGPAEIDTTIPVPGTP